MSTDAKVTKELIETLQDGEDGFARVADEVADSDTPELSTEMRRLSQQRAQFRGELEQLAREYGDDIDESGSTAGAVHRGWIALKDALTGSSPDAVLKAAVTGEDHAVREYDKALEDDISPTLRTVVERQRGEIVVARDKVSALADARS
jgi:uncharacterized protein (TIGR02284 family)